MREDVPTLARVVGIIGLFFLGLAIIAMVMRASGVKSGWIGPGLGVAVFRISAGISGGRVPLPSNCVRNVWPAYWSPSTRATP